MDPSAVRETRHQVYALAYTRRHRSNRLAAEVTRYEYVATIAERRKAWHSTRVREARRGPHVPFVSDRFHYGDRRDLRHRPGAGAGSFSHRTDRGPQREP